MAVPRTAGGHTQFGYNKQAVWGKPAASSWKECPTVGHRGRAISACRRHASSTAQPGYNKQPVWGKPAASSWRECPTAYHGRPSSVGRPRRPAQRRAGLLTSRSLDRPRRQQQREQQRRQRQRRRQIHSPSAAAAVESPFAPYTCRILGKSGRISVTSLNRFPDSVHTVHGICTAVPL